MSQDLQKGVYYGFVTQAEYSALEAFSSDEVVANFLSGLTYSQKGVYYYTAAPGTIPCSAEVDEDGNTLLDYLQVELELPINGYAGRYIWSTQGVEGLW